MRAVGIALNTSSLGEADALALCTRLADEHSLPCTDPFRMGVDPILNRLLEEVAHPDATSA